jgi:predicted ATP-grasp superfamily ATP-dependent carboligase
MRQALILGTGVVALGTMGAYAQAGIRAVHLSFKRDDLAGCSRFAAETHLVPAPPQADAELLVYLLQAPAVWSGALLDPVNDPGVVFCSVHHEALSKRYIVTVPPWRVLAGIINKSNLYRRAHEIGVPAPVIRKFETLDALREAAGLIEYPCIIKPDQTHAFFQRYKQKVLVADSPATLLAQYEDVLGHGLDVMVSEIIPGDETRYVIYVCHLAADGDVLAEMCIRKIRQHPSEYGVGSVIKTVPMIAEARDASLRLLHDYRYTGFSATEFKWDRRDQRYKLIEINTRQVLYVRLLAKAGINFCELMYADKVEGSAVKRGACREEVYWVHPFQEIYEYRARRRLPGFSLSDFIKPLCRPRTVFALSPASDPMPFLKSLGKLARAAVG